MFKRRISGNKPLLAGAGDVLGIGSTSLSSSWDDSGEQGSGKKKKMVSLKHSRNKYVQRNILYANTIQYFAIRYIFHCT